MKLFFTRHGNASSTASIDAERPLTSEGIAEAECIGEVLHHLKISLSGILASPYVRAHQTAELIRKKFPKQEIITTQHLIPSASPDELFSELKYYSRDSHLLLVSHEPFISTCIGQLISAHNETKISIKKGSLACIDVTIPVHPGGGVLLWLLPNSQMKSFITIR
jgi:phosphohistidine phosphatase